MSDQFVYIQFVRFDQVKHTFHIAILCPSHVTDRIILPILFVSGIIPARSVGTGVLQCQFLLVKRGPGNIQAYGTYENNRPLLACKLQRQFYRFVGIGRCGDNDRIRSISPCQSFNLAHGSTIVQEAVVATKRPRE